MIKPKDVDGGRCADGAGGFRHHGSYLSGRRDTGILSGRTIFNGKGCSTAKNFNSYGSRRGNHEVMMRGTFGNIRIKNHLVSPKEGSYTLAFPEKKEMFVYDAAMKAIDTGKPLVVLGGKEYGTGFIPGLGGKGHQPVKRESGCGEIF